MRVNVDSLVDSSLIGGLVGRLEQEKFYNECLITVSPMVRGSDVADALVCVSLPGKPGSASFYLSGFSAEVIENVIDSLKVLL